MSTKDLSRIVYRRSREFIPGSPGFHGHAYRHIMLTDYLKSNPNGFQIAANILHDTLETVLKNYSHVEVMDGIRYYHEYQDNIIKQWEKDRKENPEDDKDDE